MMKKVAVIMGSDSDLPIVSGAIKKLRYFGVEVETHVMSAHRTPAAAADFASRAKENGFGVIIAAAGKAAHLDALDALLVTGQMPSGIPVATVAIDGAENAAILAVQMLALSDEGLAQKLSQMKEDMAQKVLEKDAALQLKAAAL